MVTNHKQSAIEFDTMEELNTYTKKKYGDNANQFRLYSDDPEEEGKKVEVGIFTFTFNKWEKILDETKSICIKDIPMEPNEVVAIIGALNKNKSHMLESFECHYDADHLYLISNDPSVKSVELALIILDKKKYPNWIQIAFGFCEEHHP